MLSRRNKHDSPPRASSAAWIAGLSIAKTALRLVPGNDDVDD
jgi:hypothetical protein